MDEITPAGTTDDLAVYVFSFNRGVFLENCLNSLLACDIQAPVTVIDDQSDDPHTQEVLERFKENFRVVTAGKASISEHKTGGLYNNMRFAFQDAAEKGKPYALFLQDDMQLVRPVLDSDLAAASAFFKANANAAELHTCFMKRFFRDRDQQLARLDASGEAYLRPSDYPGFSGYSAVGLFAVERFRQLFGDLQQGEYANNEFAQKQGIQMGISARPFMMWLPYPISHRGKKRNIPLQIVEAVGGCGFYPFDIMPAHKVDELLNRDRANHPYAEDWLHCPTLKPTPVWSFAGGLSNLLARGGIRGRIGAFLLRLRYG